MAKKKLDNDFDLVNLPIEAQDPEIKAEDFVLTKNDDSSHEQKFQTKPTTFFKDSLKRFRKNKSSVVAAIILGILLLLAIFVPVFDTYDNSANRTDLINLTPKLFPSGTGFWDGSLRLKNIPADISADPNASTIEERDEKWWPSTSYSHEAVSKKSFHGPYYTNSPSEYAIGGFLRFYYTEKIDDETESIAYHSSQTISGFDLDTNYYLNVFDIYDANKMKLLDPSLTPDEDSDIGEAAFYLNYHLLEKDEDGFDRRVEKSVEILPFASTHNIGSKVESIKEDKINITQKVKDAGFASTLEDVSFSVLLKNKKNHAETSVYIGGIEITTDSTYEEKINELKYFTIDNPSQQCPTTSDWGAPMRWYVSGSAAANRTVHHVETYQVDFTYDPYEAVYGVITDDVLITDINKYCDDGVLYLFYELEGIFTPKIKESTFECRILDPDRCPIEEPFTPQDMHFGTKYDIYSVTAKVNQYKVKNYDVGNLPQFFLMGTDKDGHDMFKYVFEGTRLSLLLGIITSAVCFIFGLIWGAVSGYFGGTVDLVMERFTDILSGVPWIVVMTLVIIKAGSSFGTFVLALCMTGWIGTAAVTRTQFYRFRGREYVLASRTLGASDARLIAKHILPNAMGTIITSAVLMVPSVIFSEATLSYLNLGFRDLPSLGVTLSNNQTHLNTYPYLLIFPSVIIALLMICFNLFGNGLRDAVNPSLKGEDE